MAILPQRARKILVVLAIQVLVLVGGMVLAVVAFVATGGAAALAPRMLTFPLVPASPKASEQEAANALKRAFPGDEVWQEDGKVQIVFRSSEFDVRLPASVLEEHGFRTTRFTMSRDLDPRRFRSRLADDVMLIGMVLFAQPLVLLAAGLVLRRRLPPASRGPAKAPARWIVAAGIGGGLALMLAVAGVGLLMEVLGYPIVEQPLLEHLSRTSSGALLAVFLTMIALLAPLGEEFFYRGWMFPYLEGESVPLAYLASAVLFASVHFHPPALPAYLLIGLGLAALYRRSRSVWTPVLAHVTNNLIAVAGLP